MFYSTSVAGSLVNRSHLVDERRIALESENTLAASKFGQMNGIKHSPLAAVRVLELGFPSN